MLARKTVRITEYYSSFPVSRYQTCPNGPRGQRSSSSNQSGNTLPCGPCKGCPKVKWDAKAGLCSWMLTSGSSDQDPRGLVPPTQRIPAHPPVHLKSPPVPPALLAKAPSTSAGAPVGSLHLTLADLDARANLDWLPPLGPHAQMHERFAVTLAGRSLSNQRRRTAFFPPLATTTLCITAPSAGPGQHRGMLAACLPESHPAFRGGRACDVATPNANPT